MQLANIVRERWKGVLFCLIIAIPATLLGKQIEVVGGPVFAILFGMVLALVFPKNRREQLAAGVTYTSKKVLQYAVILLGFGMNLSQILSKGAQSLPIIVATISTSLVIAFVLCRVMNVPGKIATLVGVGSSICGGSAIAATAPVIDADDREIAQAISVIFLFNVIAALVFPTLGGMLGLTNEGFGLFAGTAINDTSSVTAAASARGQYASRRQCARERHSGQAHQDAGHHSHHAGACLLADASGAQGRRRRQKHVLPQTRVSHVCAVLCAGERDHHGVSASCVHHGAHQGAVKVLYRDGHGGYWF